jgi:prolyl oligopeptidase
VLKRPDLFAGLISRVVITNASRLAAAQNGANQFAEFGDPRTEAGFKALVAQDAYIGLSNAMDMPPTPRRCVRVNAGFGLTGGV